MKRIIALILALVAVCALFAACDGKPGGEKVNDKESAKLTDPQAIADALLAAGDFEAKIDKTADANVEYEFPGLPEGTKSVVYLSLAVSDTVAVFKTSDAEKTKGIVEKYVEDRIASLRDYQPEQAKKLQDNAAIVVSGDIVVLLVSKTPSVDARELVEKTINGEAVSVKPTTEAADTEKKDADTADNGAADASDVQTVAEALLAAGDFAAKIEKTADANIEYDFPGLPEGTKSVVYMSLAVSDTVAVFRTSDAEAVKGIVEKYVTDRVGTLADYQPEQAKKLEDNAAIVVSGDLVVLLVSNASSADAKALIENTVG